ncbi:hypothetical protein AMAG_07470 [Allomyces macrogynus ATCC 38327]|uniref:Uncharacterized protein n=1 Tax=Allomyces macrogynus (strain ATCC 38327) TaxID=578462 RepID=A0A0L0SI86_ALLM3|nr:hypothetical protein AMAG_07470 [Allomyces macrogynus ATCC 38327]|eukprot:KNE62231.1 hypothetical protein AMAG_07470 [Allomyces macrogynus ATCC 38327]
MRDPASSAIATSRKRHCTRTAEDDRTDDDGSNCVYHHGVRAKRIRPAGTVEPAILTGAASGPHVAHVRAHRTPHRLDPTTEPTTTDTPPAAAAAGVPLPSPDAPIPVLVAELESWTARVHDEPNPFIAVISARLCAGSIAEYILNRGQAAPAPAPARPASPVHPVFASTAAAAAQLATIAARSADLARAHAAMVQLLDSMRMRIRSDPAFETLCNDAVRLAAAAPAGRGMGSSSIGTGGGAIGTNECGTAPAAVTSRQYSPTKNRPTFGRPCSPGSLQPTTRQFSFTRPPNTLASSVAAPSPPSSSTISNDVDDAARAAHDLLVAMGPDEMAAAAATVARTTTRTPLD